MVIFFQAYVSSLIKSKLMTVPSFDNFELPSVSVLPSSLGAPTNTLLLTIQTPRPKSSVSDTLSPMSLSSMTNFVLYIVAVKAPPDPGFESTMVVSCRSNVVSPESNCISLELAKFSAPITILVPASLMSIVVPNLMFVKDPGPLIVCCRVYVLVEPSAFHL